MFPYLGCWESCCSEHGNASYTYPVFFGHISRSRTPGSYSNSIFSFLRKLHNFFPERSHQFPFLPTVHRASLFSISSPTLISSLLVIAVLTAVRYYSSRWFWFAFPQWLVISSTFSMILLKIYMSFLEKCLLSSSAILKSDSLLFLLWVVWILYIFWILTPYQIYDLKVFPPIPDVVLLGDFQYVFF